MENELKTPKITTMTVEINVIKIGNKQMTISVFNQLYTKLCYDENFDVIYDLWGRVNRECNWVIFQDQNSLFKMSELKKSKFRLTLNDMIVFLSSNNENFISSCVIPNHNGNIPYLHEKYYGTPFIINSKTNEILNEFDKEGHPYYKVCDDLINHRNYPESYDTKINKIKNLSIFNDYEKSLLKDAFELDLKRYKKHLQLIDKINNLPQLFIAL